MSVTLREPGEAKTWQGRLAWFLVRFGLFWLLLFAFANTWADRLGVPRLVPVQDTSWWSALELSFWQLLLFLAPWRNLGKGRFTVKVERFGEQR